MMSNKKICFCSSSGGHFEQLMMMRPLMEKYDGFIITEKIEGSNEDIGVKTYYLPQINRLEKLFFIKLILIFLKSIYIYVMERPQVTISTGVLATIPFCLLSKLFGTKIIYIESFAKINTPTKTGNLLYRYADRFYVQWESMLEIYPNAIYKGRLY